MNNQPILVTGIERSGSSIIAKIIAMCGANIGDVSEMMEQKTIKNIIDHVYTFQLGVPSKAQFPLPNLEVLKKLNTKYIANCISGTIKESDQPWMYKSSKIIQTWPLWVENFPNAKWVIVRRRTNDIIHSCMRTGYMSAFQSKENQKAVGANSEEEAWLWWVHQHEEMFHNLLEKSSIEYMEIWPERMVNGDLHQIHTLIDWLGLEWDDNAIKDYIQPLFRNSPQKIK